MATRHILIWCGLILVAALLYLRQFDSFQIGTYRDDAAYAVLARSLVHSSEYGLINHPGRPGGTQFPFGYPLLLSPFALFWPDNLDAMKIVSLIATLLNGAILFWGWRWFSRSRSYWWGLAVVGLYLLSPVTTGHASMVMSEAVFTTFCLIAMLLVEQTVRGVRHPWAWSVLSVTLLLSVFTRTIGVVLVAAAFALLLMDQMRQAWKPLGLVSIQMGALLGLIVLVTPVGMENLVPSQYIRSPNAFFLIPFGGGPAKSEPENRESPEPAEQGALSMEDRSSLKRAPADRILRGAERHLLSDLPSAALPFGGGPGGEASAMRPGVQGVLALLRIVVVLLIVVGFVRWFYREKLSLFPVFAVAFFGVLLFWNWIGPRLLYPIQPQIHFALLLGLEAAILAIARFTPQRLFPAQTRSWLLAAIVVVLLVGASYKSWQIDDSRAHVGDLQARTLWLRSNTPASAVVMTEEPTTDFLYGGRSTIAYPRGFISTDRLHQYLVGNGVNYVLVAPEVEWRSAYEPTHSAPARNLASLLQTLSSENRVQPVYASESSLIQVFRVQ